MSHQSSVEAMFLRVGPSPFHVGRFAFLYRYLFAIVSIVFAFNTYRCRLLLYDETGIVLTIAFAVWFTSSATFLVHWPRLAVRATNYLSATLLIVSSEGVFNVECKFFIAMAFFNMGLRLRPEGSYRLLNRHVVYAMMLSFGAYLFFGGFLTKAQDEYWNSGSGLFHVVSLPWIAPEWVRDLLLLPGVSEFANWAALVMEGVTFPLLLFRRSRKFGIVAFALFSGFLAGCLRINMIGWEAVAVACLFMQTIRWHESDPVATEKEEWGRREKVAVLFYYAIVSFGVLSACAASAGVTVRSTASYWNRINRVTVNIHYDILFTKAHFLSVDEYRVLLHDEKGQVREPVRVFAEDTLAGPESGGMLTSRWLQAEMYRTDRDVLLADKSVPSHLRRLIKYCLSQDESNTVVAKVQILVRQVSLPTPEKTWRPLINFYPDSQKFEILQ